MLIDLLRDHLPLNLSSLALSLGTESKQAEPHVA